MADDAGFKHIAVNADDDVVIRAGASVQASVPAPAADAACEPAEPSRASAQPAAAPVKAQDDGYRPTTLEDIEQSRMPLAQRIVIVAAVLAVVAFIAWCIFF